MRPSWKHRRRLVYSGFGLGVFMILFAMATIWLDTQIGVQLVIGGVALITLILSAYIAGATAEDVKLFDKYTDGGSELDG